MYIATRKTQRSLTIPSDLQSAAARQRSRLQQGAARLHPVTTRCCPPPRGDNELVPAVSLIQAAASRLSLASSEALQRHRQQLLGLLSEAVKRGRGDARDARRATRREKKCHLCCSAPTTTRTTKSSSPASTITCIKLTSFNARMHSSSLVNDVAAIENFVVAIARKARRKRGPRWNSAGPGPAGHFR